MMSKNPVIIKAEAKTFCVISVLILVKSKPPVDFCRLKIQFVELDVYNLNFQKSSTDHQGGFLEDHYRTKLQDHFEK